MTFLKYFFGWIFLAICFYELFALLVFLFGTLVSWGIPEFTLNLFLFWEPAKSHELVLRGYLWFFAIGFSSLIIMQIEEVGF